MNNCYDCELFRNNEHCMDNITFCEKSLKKHDKQIRADVIDEILNLPKLNHYDMCNELMYQSIKVSDIEKLKEQKNE